VQTHESKISSESINPIKIGIELPEIANEIVVSSTVPNRLQGPSTKTPITTNGQGAQHPIFKYSRCSLILKKIYRRPEIINSSGIIQRLKASMKTVEAYCAQHFLSAIIQSEKSVSVVT